MANRTHQQHPTWASEVAERARGGRGELVGRLTWQVKQTGEKPTDRGGTSMKGCCIAAMLCLETNMTAVALGKLEVQYNLVIRTPNSEATNVSPPPSLKVTMSNFFLKAELLSKKQKSSPTQNDWPTDHSLKEHGRGQTAQPSVHSTQTNDQGHSFLGMGAGTGFYHTFALKHELSKVLAHGVSDHAHRTALTC